MKSDNSSCSVNQARPTLAEQLAALNRCACLVKSEEINALCREYREQFQDHNLRLRPSVGGFSLVSCNLRTPQIGFSAIKSPRQLLAKLELIKADSGAIKEPKRSTPEKKLQSWLLKSAVSSQGRFKSAVIREATTQWLVSDEVALSSFFPDGRKSKIVADILLVEEGPEGARLVSVELKSSRSTETFEQVRKFRDLLDAPELVDIWREFASTMTGRQFKWSARSLSRGIVVWPSAAAASIPQRTRDVVARYRDIDVVGYSNTNDDYRFQIEASV